MSSASVGIGRLVVTGPALRDEHLPAGTDNLIRQLAPETSAFIAELFQRHDGQFPGHLSQEHVRITTNGPRRETYMGYFEPPRDSHSGTLTSFTPGSMGGPKSAREIPVGEPLNVSKVQVQLSLQSFGSERQVVFTTLYDESLQPAHGSGFERLGQLTGRVVEIESFPTGEPSQCVTNRGRVTNMEGGILQLQDPIVPSPNGGASIRRLHTVSSIKLLQLPAFWDADFSAKIFANQAATELLPQLFEHGAQLTVTSQPIDTSTAWQKQAPVKHVATGSFVEVSTNQVGKPVLILAADRRLLALPIEQIASICTPGATREGFATFVKTRRESVRAISARTHKVPDFEHTIAHDLGSFSA